MNKQEFLDLVLEEWCAVDDIEKYDGEGNIEWSSARYTIEYCLGDGPIEWIPEAEHMIQEKHNADIFSQEMHNLYRFYRACTKNGISQIESLAIVKSLMTDNYSHDDDYNHFRKLMS